MITGRTNTHRDTQMAGKMEKIEEQQVLIVQQCKSEAIGKQQRKERTRDRGGKRSTQVSCAMYEVANCIVNK